MREIGLANEKQMCLDIHHPSTEYNEYVYVLVSHLDSPASMHERLELGQPGCVRTCCESQPAIKMATETAANESASGAAGGKWASCQLANSPIRQVANLPVSDAVAVSRQHILIYNLN